MPNRPIAYRNTLTAIVACANCVEEHAYHFDEPNRFQIASRENVYEDGSESTVVMRRLADGMEATFNVGNNGYPEEYAEGIVDAREFFIPLYRPREDSCGVCHSSLRTSHRKARAT